MIWRQMHIKKEKENKYTVESLSSPGKFYEVDPHKPFCTCPAFIFKFKMKAPCKHILAVREKNQKQSKSKYEKVLSSFKEETDTIALIEKFGEDLIDEILSKIKVP